MEAAAEMVEDFLHVRAVQGYLDQDVESWAGRYAAGWTPDVRDGLRSACASILGRPEWADRVRAGLGSEDDVAFADADQAAKVLGIDTWDIHWRRLRESPANPARWYHVMTRCDESRIGPVVEFAVANIDLSVVATGPGDELGFGRGFEPHSCLDYVLQELRRFSGRGPGLIGAGLKSPVVRNRNMAVAALAAWARANWPAGVEAWLDEAARCEPKDDVRERMRKVLRVEPLPQQ